MADTLDINFNITRQQIASFTKDPRTVRDIEAFIRLVKDQLPLLLIAKVDQSRQIISGAGLTGGGDLSADRTLNIGAGTGITVAADSIALANTAVTAGNYGDASHVATFTVDAQGRLTAASNVAISAYSDEQAQDAVAAMLTAGPGISLVYNDGANTLTVSEAVSIQSVASASTVTPTFSNDQVNITAQAAALTLANPTGTAVDGWGISIRIKDNGTARAITYDTQYRAIGVTLPTTTVISKTLYLGVIFNNADTKWDVVAVAQEA